MKKLLLIALIVASGCSKKEEPKKEAPAPEVKKEEPKPEPKPEPTPEPAKDPAADYIKVSANHSKPKPTDPDVFEIPSFKVVKAAFTDPANLEGATADLELDLNSLVSNSARRDSDIKSDSYLDVAKFATVTIHIDNVKKTGDKSYTADATINAHGVEKKLAVAFDVLDSTADTVRIKGTHTFQRLDFSIGVPVDQGDSVSPDITIEMQLTLKKSA
jgi:hypothetical protein